jgi:glycosyltransferase involved in cell wall biosynthesis
VAIEILFAGTDLAPLDPGRGALEAVLGRWIAELSRTDRVSALSFGSVGDGIRGALSGTVHEVSSHAEARAVVNGFDAGVVVLSNRPLWGTWAKGPVLHILHNYPDAWGVSGTAELERCAEVLRRQPVAAVSRALAWEVELVASLPPASCAEVPPSIDPVFAATPYEPEGPVVLFPHRLLRKKGVELALAGFAEPACDGLELVVTDNLNPWSAPTNEHSILRRAVSAARCDVRLVPPVPPGAGMARLYASARAVVCPSIAPEGLGLVALEAQAVGCPLVTSGLGGLREVTLPPNECMEGLDPRSFAEAVRRAVDRSYDMPGPVVLPERFTPRGSAAILLEAITAAASVVRA